MSHPANKRIRVSSASRADLRKIKVGTPVVHIIDYFSAFGGVGADIPRAGEILRVELNLGVPTPSFTIDVARQLLEFVNRHESADVIIFYCTDSRVRSFTLMSAIVDYLWDSNNRITCHIDNIQGGQINQQLYHMIKKTLELV